MKSVYLGLGVVALVLLVRFLAALLNRRAARGPAREFKSTDEFVQALAEEAVKDAAKNNGMALDYTPASIKDAGEILGKLHDQYVQSSSSVSVRGLSAAYGAYIGEVIRRSEPNVRWERDDPAFGEKVYPLHWGKSTVYPMAWCHKNIVEGDEDNVWVKYTVIKQQKSTGSI